MDTSTWDSAYSSSPPFHSATEDDASSPSTPGSPTSSDQSSRHPSWEDICNQYEILSLHNLGDLDRAGVAYLHSARDILQVEAQLAEQYCHQQIIVLKAFELRRDKAHKMLFAQKLHLVAKVAHEDVPANVLCQASVSGAPGKLTMASSQTLIYSAHRFLVRQAGQDPRSAPATHPRRSI